MIKLFHKVGRSGNDGGVKSEKKAPQRGNQRHHRQKTDGTFLQCLHKNNPCLFKDGTKTRRPAGGKRSVERLFHGLSRIQDNGIVPVFLFNFKRQRRRFGAVAALFDIAVIDPGVFNPL